MKKPGKALKQFHTSNANRGMGTNYGVGVKQKVGSALDSYMDTGKKSKPLKKSKNQVV